MNLTSRLSDVETERLFFGLGAVVTGILTVFVFRAGNDDQGVLFGAFALYLGGAATPAIRDNVTEYKRTGAVALGGVGVVTLLMGVNSPLPALFIIGGIAALLNLF